jgi:hypothetical protein
LGGSSGGGVFNIDPAQAVASFHRQAARQRDCLLRSRQTPDQQLTSNAAAALGTAAEQLPRPQL